MIFKPHPYQAEAERRLLEHPCYGLFLDMGLGKTVITLSAIAELIYDRFEVRKVLIIAPKSVAESTWQDEARKWEHTQCLRFSTVIGSKAERERALMVDADCYVTNRENVVWLMEYYFYDPPFDMLVVDESSSFKNSQAKRFKALRKVLPLFKRRVILTGTPAPNTLLDLWSQIYLLDRGKSLGRSLTMYRNHWFVPDRRNGFVVYSYRLRDASCEQGIYDALGDTCMSLKAEDYITLPERIDNVIHVRMPAESRKAYDRMHHDLILTMQDTEITAMSAAALSNKLLQMANGRVYDDEHNVVNLHHAKLDALADIVEANLGKPVLVFYAYQHDLDMLQEAFPKARVLHGAEEMRDWNAGRLEILLAHPASTAYGLNLQAGGHIIVWYGLTWSLEQYQQANARLYRQGQREPVIVHHLVTEGTIDTKVMQALSQKAAGQDALMEAMKAEIRGG